MRSELSPYLRKPHHQRSVGIQTRPRCARNQALTRSTLLHCILDSVGHLSLLTGYCLDLRPFCRRFSSRMDDRVSRLRRSRRSYRASKARSIEISWMRVLGLRRPAWGMRTSARVLHASWDSLVLARAIGFPAFGAA